MAGMVRHIRTKLRFGREKDGSRSDEANQEIPNVFDRIRELSPGRYVDDIQRAVEEGIKPLIGKANTPHTREMMKSMVAGHLDALIYQNKIKEYQVDTDGDKMIVRYTSSPILKVRQIEISIT